MTVEQGEGGPPSPQTLGKEGGLPPSAGGASGTALTHPQPSISLIHRSELWVWSQCL